MRFPGFRRWATALALLGALLAATPACSIVRRSARHIAGRFNAVRPPGKLPDGPADRYFRAAGKSKRKPGLLYVQFNRDLWKPFVYEGTARLMDGADPADVNPAVFCLEADVRRSNPVDFRSVCVQPRDGGLFVFAATKDDNSLGQTFLGGATAVDMQLEADGAQLHFRVRPAGQGPYETVASIPFAQQDKPLTPSLFVSDLTKPDSICWETLRVVSNGDAPPGTSARRIAAEAIYGGIDAQLEAVYALDGLNPDTAGARTMVNDSLGAMDAAAAQVAALPKSRRTRKAGRNLASGRKKAVQAVERLDGGAAVGDVIATLAKALKKQYQAVNALVSLTHD